MWTGLPSHTSTSRLRATSTKPVCFSSVLSILSSVMQKIRSRASVPSGNTLANTTTLTEYGTAVNLRYNRRASDVTLSGLRVSTSQYLWEIKEIKGNVTHPCPIHEEVFILKRNLSLRFPLPSTQWKLLKTCPQTRRKRKINQLKSNKWEFQWKSTECLLYPVLSDWIELEMLELLRWRF